MINKLLTDVTSVIRDHTIIDNRMKIEGKHTVLTCWHRSSRSAIYSSHAMLRRHGRSIVFWVCVEGEEDSDERLMREI